MAEGEFALVREHGEAALTRSSQGWATVGDHDLFSLLADAAAHQCEEAALQKYTPLAEEFALRYEHKLYQAVAHRAWGVMHRLAGQYNEAEARLNQAMKIFQQMNTRWQIGCTLIEMGELAVARADNTAALDHFSQALKAFERIGAAPDISRTKARLDELS